MTEFDEWIGRSQTVVDLLEPARSNALSAALGNAKELHVGDPLPLLHHWLYFWDVKEPGGLGTDGHPSKGGFLPPVSLPRRMWAGGRLTFHKPLLLGAQVKKTSTIVTVAEKTGRTGTLVFVTVRHELDGRRRHRSDRRAGSGISRACNRQSANALAGSAPEAAWLEHVDPDPVLLFRYSALTMNGHRIHYESPLRDRRGSLPGLGRAWATASDVAHRHRRTASQ